MRIRSMYKSLPFGRLVDSRGPSSASFDEHFNSLFNDWLWSCRVSTYRITQSKIDIFRRRLFERIRIAQLCGNLPPEFPPPKWKPELWRDSDKLWATRPDGSKTWVKLGPSPFPRGEEEDRDAWSL